MEQKFLNEIYNLVLDRDIREWERQELLQAKQNLESGKREKQVINALEAQLRPLALRQNLTPKVSQFYQSISNGKFSVGLDKAVSRETDLSSKTAKVPLEYQERAIFAGGCFWCMVEPFDTRPGVLAITSGFTGGESEYPIYDTLATSGHVEAVEIIFDNRVMSYEYLLEIYWSIINPTDAGGQFLDRGAQYQSAIFVGNETQRKIAEQSKQKIAKHYPLPIVTMIRDASTFWPAEEYHQDWYKYNPKRYKIMEKARKRYYKQSILTNFLKRGQ